jgi:hypothetical protein
MNAFLVHSLFKMLVFTQSAEKLVVSGKTFYAKEPIKSHGGIWDSLSSSWSIPLEKDSPEFRRALQLEANAIEKAQKAKERAERKAQREYEASPEGIEAAVETERKRVRWCFEQDKTGAYWWICCAECNVIDWYKKHTSCMKCAEWDGYCWNSFRVNGSIFTGD